jgi:hypothetical protein
LITRKNECILKHFIQLKQTFYAYV